ncbi:hypothetical protein J2T56_001904 [Natronobacillus azotifigens]|uniref:hypothetical protein n=1 Tax=Natronobacillus azotifigens TaxID=472978 RepID=UPI003D232F37
MIDNISKCGFNHYCLMIESNTDQEIEYIKLRYTRRSDPQVTIDLELPVTNNTLIGYPSDSPILSNPATLDCKISAKTYNKDNQMIVETEI